MIDYSIALSIVKVVGGLTVIYIGIVIAVNYITKDYSTGSKEPNPQPSPIESRSVSSSVSPIVKQDFYSNLNNSSQYLRRDSFS